MGERRKISRRALFRGLGVFAGVLAVDQALSYLGMNTPLRSAWEEAGTLGYEEIRLLSEVEAAYGVRIYHPAKSLLIGDLKNPQLVTDLGWKAVWNMYKVNPFAYVVPWDKPKIKLLGETLSRLPKKFYTWPEGGRVTFNLIRMDNFQAEEDGICSCSKRVESTDWYDRWVKDYSAPVISLLNRGLRTWGVKRGLAQELTVHELTHQRINQNQVISETNLTSPLVDEALQVLGVEKDGGYGELNHGLVKLFSKHVKISGHEVLYVDGDRLGAAVMPREVIPVAAESYIHGWREFFYRFAPDLGGIRTARLYEFVGKKVFEGVEYPAGI